MKSHSRNIAVGLTVIVAMAMMAGMIVLFAGLPQVFQRGYVLKIKLDSTGGVQRNDIVHLSGIRVGKITDVRFADPADPRKGVQLEATIHPDLRVPGNARAYVSRGAMGPAYVELHPDGPERIDPATGEPMAYLPTDGTAEIDGFFKSSGIFEPLKPALESLGRLAESVESLIEPEQVPTTGPATQAETQMPGGLKGTINRLNRTLDGLYAVVGDEQAQSDAKSALANLAEAADKANDVMDALADFTVEARKTAVSSRQNMDELARGLVDTAEDVSDLMASINVLVQRIEAGEGTVGKLMSDPKLYHNLVAATENLNRMLKELKKMISEWRGQGVPLKMQG